MPATGHPTMTLQSDIATLDTLLGAALTVTVAGVELAIRPFTFGQLPRVLEIVGPFLAGLVTQGTLDLSGLLERDSERALRLCALATGKPRTWFDEAPADEGLRLLAAIAEVNADFFRSRVAPAVADLWPRMKSKFQASSIPPNPPSSDGPASSKL